MQGSVLGNFASLLYYLLFIICGLLLARLLFPDEGRVERLLFGSVLGSLLLHWLPIVFSFFFGFTMPSHILAGVAAFSLGTISAIKARGREIPKKSSFKISYLILPLSFLVLFSSLVIRSFSFKDGAVYSSQATYGDMSMHLSFMTSLARQGTFPPEYSILPGTRLSYPFLGDSISASLLVLGAGLKWAYTLPMLFAGAQVFLGFFVFAWRMLGNSRKTAIAFALFFLNGGLGILWFLGGKDDMRRLFTEFYQTPTNLTEENIRWVNIIVDMLLPQRALLFGWAVLFTALSLLYTAVFRGKKRYFLLAGIMGGLLPMIHTHSFLAFALCALGWMLGSQLGRRGTAIVRTVVLISPLAMTLLQTLIGRLGLGDSNILLLFALAVMLAVACFTLALTVKNYLRDRGFKGFLSTWGVFALCALGLSLPQLFYWTFRQTGEGFVRGHFGWVIGENNYLWFYLKNLGIAGIICFLGFALSRSRRIKKLVPALLIWFVAEFVEFQPNDYDNNKLLYVAFAFLCVAGGDFLGSFLTRGSARKFKAALSSSLGRVPGIVQRGEAAFWEASEGFENSPSCIKKRGVVRKSLVAVLVIICSVSALFTIGREWVSKYELFGSGALGLAAYVDENLPADAVILTDQRHNNEIASLTGRNIVCGSPSYLYYHGLDYSQAELAAAFMYRDPETFGYLFDEYSVDYVLISDFERYSYSPREDLFARDFPKIYDDGVRVLYSVTGDES